MCLSYHYFKLCMPLSLLTKSVRTLSCMFLCLYVCFFNLQCMLDPLPYSIQNFFFLLRCVFAHFLANAKHPNLVWSSCVWSLAVSVGGLDRQRLRSEQGSFLPAGDLVLAAWVSPKPLSPRRAPFTSVHLNLSHRFDTASLGVHSEMTCI